MAGTCLAYESLTLTHRSDKIESLSLMVAVQDSNHSLRLRLRVAIFHDRRNNIPRNMPGNVFDALVTSRSPPAAHNLFPSDWYDWTCEFANTKSIKWKSVIALTYFAIKFAFIAYSILNHFRIYCIFLALLVRCKSIGNIAYEYFFFLKMKSHDV